MTRLKMLGRFAGWSCIAIGAVQIVGGAKAEPGMRADDPTVDSHVRFMGSVFVAYGLGWLEAGNSAQLDRMRVLAGLMAAGGASRLVSRATIGRPHRFHDALLVMELAAPVLVEAAARGDDRR